MVYSGTNGRKVSLYLILVEKSKGVQLLGTF